MTRKAKRKHANATPVASQGHIKADQLPPSVQNLVRGNVINISGASDFYKKRAEVATVLENYIEPHPSFHYALKNQFDQYFLANLPLVLRGHPMGLADAVADALFYLGKVCPYDELIAICDRWKDQAASRQSEHRSLLIAE